MKKIYLFFLLLSFACFIYAQQAGTTSSNWPGEIIEGTWIMETKKRVVGETWIKITEDYYQSKGFIIKGSDTIITEQVALRKTPDGVYYTSTVEDQNNKQPISFKLTTAANNKFTFENPAHDYPKRIVYEFMGNDTLHAFIDDGSGNKRQDYYFKKIK